MTTIKKFGKSLVLPAATLLLVFTAAGSAVTVATTTTFTGIRTELNGGPKPASPMLDVNPVLERFCSQYWGTLARDGTYCRFDQSFHLNLAHAGSDLVVSRIPVVPEDTLNVESSVVPEIIVGGARYDAGEDDVKISSSGYLSFRALSGENIFTVQRVSIARCFAIHYGRVSSLSCPH